MEYKIISPLKTRHVEGWEAEVIGVQKANQKPPLSGGAIAIRQAVEFGWFEGEKPNVDEMEPKDVVTLATKVWQAYSAAMGFDVKNSPARSPITQKK